VSPPLPKAVISLRRQGQTCSAAFITAMKLTPRQVRCKRLTCAHSVPRFLA